MKLRYYQDDAISAFYDYFIKGHTGNPVAVMPTGTGKSLVIAGLIKKVMTQYPFQRILCLTHVQELIEQNSEKLRAYWPQSPHGIYCSGLGLKELGYPVTFASIASVHDRAHCFGHIDLVVIDECHLVSEKDDTMYRGFIQELLGVNPYLKVLGLTATDYRLKSGRITENGLFTDVCYNIATLEGFNRLVDEGYLCPLITKKTVLEYDLEGVSTVGGDYNKAELERAVNKDTLTEAAVLELIMQAREREHWLIFSAGIEHGDKVVEALQRHGIAAAAVHSKLKKKDRAATINDFKQGKFRCLVNTNILTTGFDFPAIDVIGVLRPTKSPGLWVQMLGRGTRPVYATGYDLENTEQRLAALTTGGKPNCLVLDFAGNTRRLGPINDPVIPGSRGKKKGGTAPVKICEACETYNHASVRYCISCGFEFHRSLNIFTAADTVEVMKKGVIDFTPTLETFTVNQVLYAPHIKEGKYPSIKVSYVCGLRMFTEWVCLEHPHASFPAKKARDWWRLRTGQETVPEKVEQALQFVSTLKVPARIVVWTNTRYPEVRNYEFE